MPRRQQKIWASEDMRIRYEMPYLCEVESPLQDVTSYAFRSCCAILQDKVTHFLGATNKEDLENVTFQNDCPYRKYELGRLSSLLHSINIAQSMFLLKEEKMKEREVVQMKALLLSVDLCLKDVRSLKECHSMEIYDNLQKLLREILTTINAYELPKVRPRVVELTDAGPGVGVSNIEVRIRSAEKVMIHNLDRLTRIHRSRGDSGQNEAERTNALIGNAISDGGSIKWDYFKIFEGMSQAEKDEMTSDDIKKHEEEHGRMHGKLLKICN
ncbi:hypothetical protein JTE90_029245 [Oedothorax gibbosus]|uniref:Uncharacterized protein n=1 Tax=Oedothorax gibbosus TaxID=931172 RepID=A0AAV6TWD5_9ARAC|nr:hypothetical protein JTE90_029245 [Oedothorax gibbosus]